jgi:uncharacterized membrane protein (DUF441 family)
MPASEEQNGRPPSFRESFGEAMRKTGLGQVAPGEVPTGRSLLKAVGGVRGLVESILPGLGFLVLYTTTKNLLLSVLAPLVLAMIFVASRFIAKSAATQALAGIVVLAVSAVLALVSGKPENNFVFGIWINSVFLLAILVSIAVRWPVIGVIVGFLTNEPTAWRTDRAKRRVLLLATWLWAGLFSLRLIVELPLYLAHETVWLAGARLITGVPLYAILLWVTWLLVRTVYAKTAQTTDETSGP